MLLSLSPFKFVEQYHCPLQHFYLSLVTEGADPTFQFEWISEEGRLKMIGVGNETFVSTNVTSTQFTLE